MKNLFIVVLLLTMPVFADEIGMKDGRKTQKDSCMAPTKKEDASTLSGILSSLTPVVSSSLGAFLGAFFAYFFMRRNNNIQRLEDLKESIAQIYLNNDQKRLTGGTHGMLKAGIRRLKKHNDVADVIRRIEESSPNFSPLEVEGDGQVKNILRALDGTYKGNIVTYYNAIEGNGTDAMDRRSAASEAVKGKNEIGL